MVIETSVVHDRLMGVAVTVNKGRAALLSGDNITAARFFTDAASALGNISRHFTGESKNTLLMQAAELYFEASDYKQCMMLTNNLTNRLGGKLHEEANRRAQTGYVQGVRLAIKQQKDKGNHEAALEMLRDNILAYDPIEVATLRAECCDGMGQSDLAARFRADAAYLRGA